MRHEENLKFSIQRTMLTGGKGVESSILVFFVGVKVEKKHTLLTGGKGVESLISRFFPLFLFRIDGKKKAKKQSP